MKYRHFGKLKREVSSLGFGVMRLPQIMGKPGKIDEDETIKMVRYAIDQGVNYLDLGYPYDLRQHKRRVVPIARALQEGYRQKIMVTASLPACAISSSLDFERYLNKQLEWLATDRIDYFLLAGLNRETWPKLQGLDILRLAEGAMADGRIDKLGFSFHDHFQFLKSIINAYDNWALGQFQYSYMDIDHHPGVSGLNYAAEKGLGVVITNPLKGGGLTREPQQAVARVWASNPQKRSLSEWGLRWVWNHPEISTVVIDMSSMEQVVENTELANQVEADSLSVQEEVLISHVREAYRKLRHFPCTACRSCMPCPQGIDAPRIFELYNDAIMYGDIQASRSLYWFEGHVIDRCDECGECIKTCGKKIAIPEYLKDALRLLGKDG